MSLSARSERNLWTEAVQQGLQQAKTGAVYSIIQTNPTSTTESLVSLCEYHLSNALDFSGWHRGTNVPNESIQ